MRSASGWFDRVILVAQVPWMLAVGVCLVSVALGVQQGNGISAYVRQRTESLAEEHNNCGGK
jgi:hypothetical protein